MFSIDLMFHAELQNGSCGEFTAKPATGVSFRSLYSVGLAMNAK